MPCDILSAIKNLNENYISEIRLRKGQPVIIEYKGEYKYLCGFGVTDKADIAAICRDPSETLYRAMDGSVYSFSEQIKEGFVTVKGGIRIGIAGEYVTENGRVKTIKNVTSLNIRIPHNVTGCGCFIYEKLLKNGLSSILLYSSPGFGKTTMLRDLISAISRNYKINILVLDVRNEISGGSEGYNLGENVDVILSCDKLVSMQNVIRAMKPQLIATDELYGDDDIRAVKYAKDCGIYTLASSHICSRAILQKMPFDYYVRLTGIDCKPEIYDKNFDIVCDSGAYNVCGRSAVGGKEKENGGVQRTLRI
ncbi:MAG: hypothetical protein LUD27_03160 [Clostridia bacterium]|nr:hypothetical protein [Clostridia bacterium]